MKVEIKSVKECESEFGKFKAVELANGTKYNVGSDKLPYKYINEGFTGMAEIETAKSKKGTIYIKTFKEIKGETTRTAQKASQQASKSFKCDPDKLEQGEWIRRHTSWIGCLNNAIGFYEDSNLEQKSEQIIKITNQFYDALCKKVDNKDMASKPDNSISEQAQADAEVSAAGTDDDSFRD